MSTRRRLAVSLVAAAAAAGAVPLFVGSPASSVPAPAQCPSTPSFDYTMRAPAGPPAAVNLASGGGTVAGYAALGSDAKLYYQGHEYSNDPLLVTELACPGGLGTDAPAVINNTNTGGVTFFVRAANGKIYYRDTASTLPSAGDPDYSSLGSFFGIQNVNFTSGVGAVQTPDGIRHIFGRGTNGALYHAFETTQQPTPGSPGFGYWRVENLGGSIVGQPVVTVDGTNVVIAATTPGGAIYTKRGSSFAWGPYVKIMAGRTVNGPIFTTATSPALATNATNGAVTLYAVASQKGLYRLTKAAGATAFPATVWERVDTVLPADARIAAVEEGDVTPTTGTGNAIVYATWLDRTTNSRVATYTQFNGNGTGSAWGDYRLVPYSCFQCAPSGGVSTTSEKTKNGTAKVKVQKSDPKVKLAS